MPLVHTPWIGRRRLVLGISAAAASLLVPGLKFTQAALIASPRQTEGPFYPDDWDGDADNDLVVVAGEAARAMGQVTHVEGRVLDILGAPVPETEVEIWQCDAQGVYRHPRDERGGRGRDPGFQGRGRTIADAAGKYRFRTIRPVPYNGRTAHIHFKVQPPGGSALITQMYVFGEERNAVDGVLNSIRDERQRDSVIVRLDPADRLEPGALAAVFDIVIG
ncbi:MAG: protocatechuate 3,4-dioxygenase [Pseudomonadota bacterium]|nr:protocatechuate 3,4-dioxygenase [Pseudomonadota bacterium]